MNKTLDNLIQNNEFWYKIGVHYDEALKGAKSNSEIKERLLDDFVRRKRRIIEDDYVSIEDFKESIKESSQADKALIQILAKYLWYQNKNGETFLSEKNFEDVLSNIEYSNRVIVECVDTEFTILWPSIDKIDTKVDEIENEVTGLRYLGAKPVILRRKDDKSFEIRGRTEDKKGIYKSFKKEEGLIEEEPELVSESIAKYIEELLTSETVLFKITGIEFSESMLPENSSIKIKNYDSIYRDIEVLKNKNLISLMGMSEIKKLYLHDKEGGNNIRISVKHGGEGFEFELIAPKVPDFERDRFRISFENITGIKFGKIYEYSSQADERHLVDRILSGSPEAYEKYYEKLSDEAKEFINKVVKVHEEKRKICQDCGNQLKIEDDKCDKCGSTEFFEPTVRKIPEVQQKGLFSLIKDKMGELSPISEKLKIENWNIDKAELGKQEVLLASFHCLNIEGKASTSSYEEIYFVPLGNRKPKQIDEYLLKSVFITYGSSASSQYDGFGELKLYDLMFKKENKEELLGKAIYDSIIGVDERRFYKSKEAKKTATLFIQKIKEIEDISTHKEELNKIYNDTRFEKDIFYLLKGIFPLSERWGKSRSRESDGLVI